MINLSIIIVNYNVDEKLLECIKSIKNAKHKTKFEIIVVDNSEKDSLSKKLNKISYVKYIKTKKNIGYGAAMNLGAEIAKGEYLFILNPDTLLISGKLDSLVSFSKKHKKTGIVAPLLLNENNKAYELQGTKELTPKRAIFSLSILSKLSPKNKIYKEYYLKNWNKETIKEVDVVPGTAFLIKKDLFKTIGGFDEKFFLFFEEFDLCKRLRDKGYKNFINPTVRFYHEWGASTKKNPDTVKYFEKSRFYYFRKNYGVTRGLLTETVLRISIYSVVIGIFLGIGLFLRVDRLPTLMTFIADQGLFYLPAKDILTQGIIPLVGPETSHPWIHHGAHWIYVVAVIFYFFGFNPITPAYFIAILGVVTILLFYFMVKDMFGRNIAFLSTILFSVSPLLVTNSRLPYHTSPIPFFVIALFWLTYKLVQGNVWTLPLITFLIGVLYNHEITTFVFAISVGIVILYGFIKKKLWFRKIINIKLLMASLISFIIPMIPFIIYDINHGYNQTVKFLVWVVYRIIKFPLSLLDPRFKSPGSSPSTVAEFFLYYKKLVFAASDIIPILFAVLTIIFILVFIYKHLKFGSKKIPKFSIPFNYGLLFLFSLVGLSGLAMHRVPIEADTLLISPFIILLTAISIFWICRNKIIPALVIVLIIAFANIYMLFHTKYFTYVNGKSYITISKQVKAVEEIIMKADGRKYNLIGKGTLDTYKSFTMPYEYLLWWKGNGPVKNNVPLDITIWVRGNDIIVLTNDEN